MGGSLNGGSEIEGKGSYDLMLCTPVAVPSDAIVRVEDLVGRLCVISFLGRRADGSGRKADTNCLDDGSLTAVGVVRGMRLIGRK